MIHSSAWNRNRGEGDRKKAARVARWYVAIAGRRTRGKTVGKRMWCKRLIWIFQWLWTGCDIWLWRCVLYPLRRSEHPLEQRPRPRKLKLRRRNSGASRSEIHQVLTAAPYRTDCSDDFYSPHTVLLFLFPALLDSAASGSPLNIGVAEESTCGLDSQAFIFTTTFWSIKRDDRGSVLNWLLVGPSCAQPCVEIATEIKNRLNAFEENVLVSKRNP